MTEKTYLPSGHPGNSCRPRPNPAESAYLRQASSTLTSNPRVVSPYEPGIIRLSHSLPIRHGPIRNCGPITGKPDVMPPGWQITPDKRARVSDQSLERSRLRITNPNAYTCLLLV